ncbi:MAG: TetR family transcriptional regulator [Spirochaetales bacterium]|nr:TetR family transcriptional regulator [Spirochaetales bacterium]
MSRWQPDAPQRLQQAAMELFLEKGYEGTTVEEIAQRAQLTQRTFFRYFADKREVLFWGTGAFEAAVVDGVRNEKTADPLERVVRTLEGVASGYFDARAEAVRLRRSVIQSSPELQEREGQKMGRIVERTSEVLITEGIEARAARFAVELGVLVFRRAFEQWAEAEGTTLASTIRTTLEQLRALTRMTPPLS